MKDAKWKNDRWFRRFSPLAIVGMVVGGLALAVVFAFLFGWVVMLLWNWLMPVIFGLPRIGFWQGWGLVLLAHILIKPGYGSGSHGKKHWRGNGRGGEDADWQMHCGPDSGSGEWHAEMRARFKDGASDGEQPGNKTDGKRGDDDSSGSPIHV